MQIQPNKWTQTASIHILLESLPLNQGYSYIMGWIMFSTPQFKC